MKHTDFLQLRGAKTKTLRRRKAKAKGKAKRVARMMGALTASLRLGRFLSPDVGNCIGFLQRSRPKQPRRPQRIPNPQHPARPRAKKQNSPHRKVLKHAMR